ncbi:MAG: NAD(P)H-binding protein [Bacteroidota bacterium]
MKILVLGATGRTGRWVVDAALDAGNSVHCLARNMQRIAARPELTVFDGNPAHADALAKAMEGCEGIINVLNVSRKSDFPWAPLRTPPTFLSEVMTNVIRQAEANPVARLVVCSAWGVAETRADIPGWFRWFIDHSNIGAAYQDHERQEALVTASNLSWTIVRPVGLTNGSAKRGIRASFDNQPAPNMLISRRSVAHYLVECLSDDRLVGKKVVISRD